MSVGCGWPNNKRLSEKYKGHVLFPFADTMMFGYDVVVSILCRGESWWRSEATTGKAEGCRRALLSTLLPVASLLLASLLFLVAEKTRPPGVAVPLS